MLDLGRAPVGMGSDSLEHPCEGEAVRPLTTLRPSDSLGEGPAHGVAVLAHHADGPLAAELDDAQADQLVEVVAGRLAVEGQPRVRGQPPVDVAGGPLRTKASTPRRTAP